MKHNKRIFIVTGAAGGIGRATLKALANSDTTLICVDINEQGLEEIPLNLGCDLVKVKSDLSDLSECRRVVSLISAPISGLIHLAGAHGQDLELGKDQSHWEKMINANLKNAYDLTTAVMENLDSSRLVHFVFTTSIAYRRGAYENIAYSISKAGIVGLTRSLAKRIGSRGVVNAIAPGIIETKMPGEYISRHKDRLLAQIPMHRFGEVEEAANLIAFLMSDKCTYVTGQVINIDGGSFNS